MKYHGGCFYLFSILFMMISGLHKKIAQLFIIL